MTPAVRRLKPEDDRAAFQCGDEDLDRFFHRFAGQNQFRHHIGTTYVAVDASAVVGFVTVVPSEIAPERLPARRGLPKYPLPVLRLARLAVDVRAKGRGVGAALLRAAFMLAQQMAEEFGCVGIAVDAKADAVAFYERFGFVRLNAVSGVLGERPAPRPMFLELGAISRPAA